MSKRNHAVEVLAVSLVSVGAVVLFRALMGNGSRQVQKVTDTVDPHNFAVAYATNGGEFHFVGSDHDQPKPPFKTFGEAMRTARQFVASSGPIKGKAKIRNVRTGREQEVTA
jgi:hypothetical protein